MNSENYIVLSIYTVSQKAVHNHFCHNCSLSALLSFLCQFCVFFGICLLVVLAFSGPLGGSISHV